MSMHMFEKIKVVGQGAFGWVGWVKLKGQFIELVFSCFQMLLLFCVVPIIASVMECSGDLLGFGGGICSFYCVAFTDSLILSL